MSRRTAVTAALAAAAAFAGAAPIVGHMTASDGGTAAAQMTMPMPSAAATTGPAVAISDLGYTPETIVAAPGQHVVWTNGGSTIHTVTADAGAFDSGNMQPKGTFDFMAPAATGTFLYHCTYHAFMHGTLVVSAISLEGPKVAVGLGKMATVRGRAPGAAAGTPVMIESFAAGAWTQIATTTVAADASYRVATPALTANTVLRAHVGADISPSLIVSVAPRVTVKRAGKRVFTVTVKPARAAKARLERLNHDTFRWANVRSVRITGKGTATVNVPKAGGTFRVKLLPTTKLAAANSPSLTFR